jgi:hypothetical protein
MAEQAPPRSSSLWQHYDSLPPQPQLLDRHIRKAGGTTLTLNLKQSHLQRDKLRLESREEEIFRLVEENGMYRWEIAYHLRCSEYAKRLSADVHDLVAEMRLENVYAQYGAAQAADSMWEFADRLTKIVSAFDRGIEQAGEEWQRMCRTRKEDIQALRV